ncbi:hypothetical protein DSM106972_046390 [Dulcicalothrix desertica PCC 7102]|uniref:DUF928 domain-containing protein n=1 Tax=Dulcicalothrix desertica PCC 7102 TaxID=232991 RepID=A0A3S1IYC0_9CYAN|nr:DUF928 domain-containing protein [Dulcicalothrix desertica]RUT04411.1 hypothetical protein DSM106972_046390 [Dulcicalothrix desertica PCC 7102]TWH51265.1 uncharacterized protein DUF928 [Dulcicalothrix desertica PCC 7102]
MKRMFLTALILSSTIQYPMQAIAQTPKPAPTKSTSRPVFIPPKLPPNIGTVSGRRTGMGSRDNCSATSTELTALVPSQSAPAIKQTSTSQKEVVGGLTTSERPTFLFYVPYTSSSAESSSNAQFTLQDSQGNEIYRSQVALPSNPSVINVTLASNVALQVDKQYQWFFKVRCTIQQAASVPIYVEGSIQRVNLNPSIISQLETATPVQKAAIYAANGIWFDSINILAQLRSSNEVEWQSLLQSIGLSNISNIPFSQTLTN